jgi:hypothetical protein
MSWPSSASGSTSAGVMVTACASLGVEGQRPAGDKAIMETVATVVLLVTGLVAAAICRGACGRWLRRRRLTPELRELERLAGALLRQTRHLSAGATVQDPQSGRWFGV